MFDAGSTSMGIEVGRVQASGEAQARVEYDRAWLALHARIKEAGREECVVKARIVELLLEADETKLYRRMGYATMFAYGDVRMIADAEPTRLSVRRSRTADAVRLDLGRG